MNNQILVAPSLLSADFGELNRDIKDVEDCGADWLHIDVMDGSFVLPITFGDNMVSTARKISKLPLDVHLMIVEPEKHLAQFKNAGADSITIHVEATKNPEQVLKQIRALGLKAGITLKPATKIEEIEPLIELCDLALVMTVNPGWSGQKFMPEGLKKIERIKELVNSNNLRCNIEVDGGINAETGKMCVDAGADVLVAGSFIFGSKNRKDVINSLRNLREHRP
jgi:ribulose-phosphate 3-epimerase